MTLLTLGGNPKDTDMAKARKVRAPKTREETVKESHNERSSDQQRALLNAEQKNPGRRICNWQEGQLAVKVRPRDLENVKWVSRISTSVIGGLRQAMWYSRLQLEPSQ